MLVTLSGIVTLVSPLQSSNAPPTITFVPDFTVSSKSRVKAEITLFDEKGIEGEVSSTYFETGLNREDIKAKWINPELNLPDFYFSALNNTPLNKASYLVKKFKCLNKELFKIFRY